MFSGMLKYVKICSITIKYVKYKLIIPAEVPWKNAPNSTPSRKTNKKKQLSCCGQQACLPQAVYYSQQNTSWIV